MMNEQQLIARAQKGDTAAFERLINLHGQYVFNLALRVVKDPHDAEDIAQEAFIRVWRGLARFRGDAQFRTWLYRIVTNLCYNKLPNLKAALVALEIDETALNLPDQRQSVEDRIISNELRKTLHRSIDELPDSYRLLLSLRHLQDMSYQEIVQVTGMPLGTVKTGIFRARRMLKTLLDANDQESILAPKPLKEVDYVTG